MAKAGLKVIGCLKTTREIKEPMNFLDIKIDFAFKKVFSSEGSKDILINFLNAGITFENNQKIKSLTIVGPYNSHAKRDERYLCRY